MFYDFIVIGRKIILEGKTISVVWHTCYSGNDTSFEILKCNIKTLEIYHTIMINNTLQCRCRMFSEQLKFANQTLTSTCLFMSSYFLTLLQYGREDLYLNIKYS